MTRREFALVASTATISSLLAFFAGASLTTSPEEPPREAGPSAVATRTASSDSVARGRAEPVARESAAVASSRDSRPLDTGPAAEDRRHEDPGLVMEKQKKVGETFTRLFESGSPAAVNARVEERFYSEELNRDWAASREGHIRALFLASDDLRGVDAPQVACRSKNCQVVMPVANETQVQELTQKFMRVATRSDVGMPDKLVTYFPDVATGRLVFYLSENHNLELFE